MTKEDWKMVTGREPEHVYTVMRKGRDEIHYWEAKSMETLKEAKAYKAHCKKVDAEYHHTGMWSYQIVDENGTVCA